MSTEDKGQVSGLEVELAVPAIGTEQPSPQEPVKTGEAEAETDQEQGAAPGEDSEEERSAKAERRRRARERNRQREAERDEIIARQGEIIETLVNQMQGLSGHAQTSQIEQARSAHAAAKADLAKAYESGDPLKVADATEALTIARLNLDAVTHRRPARPQPARPQAQGEGQQQQPNPYQAAWLSRNDWYRDPERIEDAEIAFGISRALVSEGYPETDPEHFVELDRRLKKRGVNNQPASGHQPPKVVIASGQRQSFAPGKQKVTLSPRVQEHAAKFGLDLKNPEVAKRIAQRFAAQQTR